MTTTRTKSAMKETKEQDRKMKSAAAKEEMTSKSGNTGIGGMEAFKQRLKRTSIDVKKATPEQDKTKSAAAKAASSPLRKKASLRNKNWTTSQLK
jgi:hypothetical protein